MGNTGDPTGGSGGSPTTPPHFGATPDDYPAPTQADLDENGNQAFGLLDGRFDFYEGRYYGSRGYDRPTQPSVAFCGAVQFTFLPNLYWPSYYIGYYQQDPPDNDPDNSSSPPLGPISHPSSCPIPRSFRDY